MILVEYLPNLEVYGRREGNGEEHIEEDREEREVGTEGRHDAGEKTEYI